VIRANAVAAVMWVTEPVKRCQRETVGEKEHAPAQAAPER